MVILVKDLQVSKYSGFPGHDLSEFFTLHGEKSVYSVLMDFAVGKCARFYESYSIAVNRQLFTVDALNESASKIVYCLMGELSDNDQISILDAAIDRGYSFPLSVLLQNPAIKYNSAQFERLVYHEFPRLRGEFLGNPGVVLNPDQIEYWLESPAYGMAIAKRQDSIIKESTVTKALDGRLDVVDDVVAEIVKNQNYQFTASQIEQALTGAYIVKVAVAGNPTIGLSQQQYDDLLREPSIFDLEEITDYEESDLLVGHYEGDYAVQRSLYHNPMTPTHVKNEIEKMGFTKAIPKSC